MTDYPLPADDSLIDELAHSAFPGDPAPALRSHLISQAEHQGLLDVAYRSIDSPLGPLLLATTSAGLVRIAFEGEGHADVLAQLASDISPRILASRRHLDPAARQLDEYFAGTRQRFDIVVDLRLVRGFRRTVIDRLGDITYGTTVSYSAVARATGRPAAVRAVGTACAHNPVPVVVPCHRVVRSDGTIGRYLGGTEAKQLLLALESRRTDRSVG